MIYGDGFLKKFNVAMKSLGSLLLPKWIFKITCLSCNHFYSNQGAIKGEDKAWALLSDVSRSEQCLITEWFGFWCGGIFGTALFQSSSGYQHIFCDLTQHQMWKGFIEGKNNVNYPLPPFGSICPWTIHCIPDSLKRREYYSWKFYEPRETIL